MAALSDSALGAGLVQPDQTTCGSSVLVVAQMLNDEGYAAFLVNGINPATGRSAPGTLKERFRDQVLAMHRTTSQLKDSGGGLQFPWPERYGTQPWALARAMTLQAGVRGRTYSATPILPSRRSIVFGQLVRLSRAGTCVPLFVGNRLSPRHVVLVLPDQASSPDFVRIYDPASGHRYPIHSDDFIQGKLDVAGWQVPWVVVTPG